MYATYTFYTEEFFGNVIPEEDFTRLSTRASDFLDYYTRRKAASVVNEATLALLKKACCAVAEQMYSDEQAKALALKAAAAALEGNGEVKSETVGSWSVSYATASDYASGKADAVKDASAGYALIAQQYLANTGLLYRGGCFA